MSRQQSTQSINVIFYLHMEVFTQFKLSFCSSLYCLHELHVLQWLPMHTQWELFPMWWWWPLCQPCPFFLASSCMQHQDWLHQCRTCLCFHPQLWTGIGIYLNYRVVQVTTVVTCSLETKSGTNSVLAVTEVLLLFSCQLIPLYTWQLLLHWKLLEGRHYTSLIWHQFYSTVPCLTRGRRCSLTVLKQLNNVYK